MSFLAEFWRFIRVRKKYWLLPAILVMVLFGGLLVLSQGSAVAPFMVFSCLLGGQGKRRTKIDVHATLLRIGRSPLRAIA